MPIRICPVVEGFGEIEAVPILLGKIRDHLGYTDREVQFPGLINAEGESGISNPANLEGVIRRIDNKFKNGKIEGVIIIVDTEGYCGKDKAVAITNELRAINPLYPVVVICPVRMFEAWLLASMESISDSKLNKNARVKQNSFYRGNPELEPDPKTWITSRLERNNSDASKKYSEVKHQHHLTKRLDVELVLSKHVRSFQRLVHAVSEIISFVEQDIIDITP